METGISSVRLLQVYQNEFEIRRYTVIDLAGSGYADLAGCATSRRLSRAHDRGTMSLTILLKDLSNKPHVPERVHYSTLQHPANRLWSTHRMLMFFNGAMFSGSGSQSLVLHCDGIINEQLDPDSGESDLGRSTGTVWGRLLREKEFGSINCESRHNGLTAIEVPKDYGVEGSLIEGDRAIYIINGQHRTNLRAHRVSLGIQTSTHGPRARLKRAL